MQFTQSRRKIVKLTYSFFVSCPITWIRSMGLKTGDLVEPTILEDGSLLFRPIKAEVQNAETQPGA